MHTLLRVAQRVAYQANFGYSASLPGPSETLPALERRLAERRLAFERLDAAWLRGRTAIERVAVWKAAKPG